MLTWQFTSARNKDRVRASYVDRACDLRFTIYCGAYRIRTPSKHRKAEKTRQEETCGTVASFGPYLLGVRTYVHTYIHTVQI